IIHGLLAGSSSHATVPHQDLRGGRMSRREFLKIWSRSSSNTRADRRRPGSETTLRLMRRNSDRGPEMAPDVEEAAQRPDQFQAYRVKAGYETASARSGPEAVELARTLSPDVIVLDLGLPGLDGMEVMRRIRTFSDCYVLITTARSEEVDRLVGLSVGADDYLTKPFSVRELVARVQAVLRRPRADSGTASSDTVRTFGELEIDTAAQEVRLASRPL